jgi:vacuolar-type H+-ATPase subunit E/Vma4
MDDEHRISQLEKALIEQAESLVRERRLNAHATRDRLLDESSERLATLETHERQQVRAEAERLVRRRAQAAEGRMTAELDRLRWALTQAAISNLRPALVDLVRDRPRYADVLAGYVAVADRMMPPGDLVAEVNAHDFVWLEADWANFCERVAPGRPIQLVGHDRDSLGGVLVRLADNRARLDQGFEARLERLAETLAGVVMARMFAGPPELGGLHG